MFKKKPFFVVFEGIEGSGKSYQSNRLYKKLKQKKFPVILTREPGGTKTAEKIRNVILDDYFHKDSDKQFDKNTDTLLYLAARNEHLINRILPAIKKNKIVICDRFIDSTFAYQIYGKSVSKDLVDGIHKHILGNIKPNLTILLTVKISKALSRLKKRKKKNRYDKFSKKFYIKAQNAFVKISKKNKKKYLVLDSSNDDKKIEQKILEVILNRIK
ncbi:MAG: dTMP kinase [Pelagibacterales bacterium MED-G40]|nr:MAG: dTMP kinase [Pelagibacterales bacterium MED-G40]|tara:strand:+ start:2775 stop:3419 length:645 start_codon:yes stop_codon:yes gene_type:complete